MKICRWRRLKASLETNANLKSWLICFYVTGIEDRIHVCAFSHVFLAILKLRTARSIIFIRYHGRIQTGGGEAAGPDSPLKNHKNIGFPSNIDPDLLKSQSYQASI